MTTAVQATIMFDEATHVPVHPSAGHINHGMDERRLYEIPGIKGLYYFPGFLDHNEQCEAVKDIDVNQWRHDLERRVQHYGWRYDYRARTITSDMYLGPLPDWVTRIARCLCDETRLFDRIPEQVIVNEYYPRQGIALHADRNCFGKAVATISLGDDWEMKFRPVKGASHEDRSIMLQRGSALVLTGDARYRWLHGIDKRKTERDNFGQRERQRRLSLTFRTVINQQPESTPTGNDAVAA